MVVVKNSSEAQKHPLHPAGDDFAFKITDVKILDDFPDKFILVMTPPANSPATRCEHSEWIWNDPASYPLKRFCEACNLETTGGFDSNSFIGKAVVCKIVHNKGKKKDENGEYKVYANVDVESLRPYLGKLKEQEAKQVPEDDAPF